MRTVAMQIQQLTPSAGATVPTRLLPCGRGARGPAGA